MEARCPVCQLWVAVRPDGTLRGHGASLLVDSWCAGALTVGDDERERDEVWARLVDEQEDR